MTKKSLFIEFLESCEIDFEVLSYDELVNNEGEDGIEAFTGKEIYPDEEVFWFVDREPLFYRVKKEEDLTDEDINYMLMYCSNGFKSDDQDLFVAYSKFITSNSNK